MADETDQQLSIWRRLYNRIRSNSTNYEAASGMVLAILVGVIAGYGSVAFRWLVKTVQEFFFNNGETILGFMKDYYIILLPAIGGIFVGLLIYHGAREAKGHGVPEVMEAIALRGGRIRPRVAIVKAIASALTIGSGGSAGSEGPIVQIGSGFGSTVGQLFKLSEGWTRTLVACGAAGGVAAIFNAPVGGVFFALEVILGRFVSERLGYVVISSVVADVISRIVLGNNAAFGIIEHSTVSYWELIPYAILGIAAAVVGFGFNWFLYKVEDVFDGWKIPDYYKPAVGGLLVGIIGLYSFDLLGVGYGEVPWLAVNSINQALSGDIVLPTLLILLILKLLATAFSLGSGGSGGIFAPSFYMGAMLGGAFGTMMQKLFPTITGHPGAYAMVGMAAMFAGIAKAPLSAIIILFEMTVDYKIMLPLLIAVVASTVVSRALSRESVYTMKLMRKGIDIRDLEQTSPMREVKVSEAMTKNFPTVPNTMPLKELVTRLSRSGHHGFPVVDENDGLIGIVSLSDVETAVAREDAADLTVDDICTKTLITAAPDDYIHDVFVRLGTRDFGRIPVVERTDPKHVIGVLRRSDILKAYTKVLTKSQRKAAGS